MKKYKICVYAICKNEEKFVNRWVESMKEADDIYVLDTGSTDNTVEKLKELKINVNQKIIKPWRFDTARNESLKLIPNEYDIYVCTDLDEIFVKGWREKLEKNWNENTTRARYTYNWKLDENNKPLVSFFSDKIHNKNYIWKHPVHEVLEGNTKENIITIENIILNHYPDTNKSRSSYLPLLELSVKEDPLDDRNMHYLGREYMYYGRWNEAIDTLIKHTKIESAWYLERAASMRFISRCYQHLGRDDEALIWLNKAVLTSPSAREPYVELAFLKFKQKKYMDVITTLLKAKLISKNELLYINEPFCFDSTIDDLLSISYYNLGLKDEAIFYVDKALAYNNKDERLINNKKIFEK